jgi:glutamate-5-semialdehyde dehydrogenase
MDIKQYARNVVESARKASRTIARATTDQKNAVLERMASNILEEAEELKAANRKDMDAGRKAGLSSALLDRLELTDKRICEMADAIRAIVAL